MTQDHQAENAAIVPPPPAETAPDVTDEASGKTVEAKPVNAGFANGLLGGAAVSLLVVGGLVAGWPLIKDQVLGMDGSRLANLERQSDELSQKVALLQGSLPSQANGETSLAASFNQRLASVEQRLSNAADDPRLTSMSQKLDQSSADNAKLHDEMASLRNAIPPEGTILRLAERAESAEKAAREISSQHAQSQALLLVVGQLRDAIDRGDSYELELHAARRVAPPEETSALDSLSANAANGIPRRAALLNSFPVLVPSILRATIVPQGDALWQRALAKLAALVTIRRIDGQGNDTASVLARAEMAVRDGDLAKAAQELTALDGAPAETAAPWIKDALARTAADHALSELAATAIAQTGRSGG